MLSQQDLKQIAQKGITQEQIENQLNEFKTGFPFLKLEAAAGIGRGIIAPNADERKKFEDIWNAYKAEGKRVVKFVPASGAASRMFKNMFAFVDADYDVPTTDFEKKYFDSIEKFAFYEALDAACQKNEGKGIKALMAEGKYMWNPESEEFSMLMKSLYEVTEKLVKGKTLIVIAHRLSTIVDADKIFVIHQGNVEAVGTQEELLENCELYHKMWEAHSMVKDEVLENKESDGEEEKYA